jgi:UDP-glucuronate 4-epimerase
VNGAKEVRAPILVTGAAGFIGHATAHRLLERGERVIGVDIVNDYYDPALKEARLASFNGRREFSFHRVDIADVEAIGALVREHKVRRIVHLAAQAGVRYSLENPFAYERSNLAGHLSLLEASRHAPDFEHLVYASSSSVYGDRPLTGQGFREDDPVDMPVSLYAATKRSCELISQSYAKLYGFPQTGLRFFTVYGPWGRPDMAYFSFTRKILAGEPIEVYGEGRMARDFTYVDDIVAGILAALDRPPPGEAPHRIFNLGSGRSEKVTHLLESLERLVGRRAMVRIEPGQSADPVRTCADIGASRRELGYEPATRLEAGLPRFVDWYRAYHGVPAPSLRRSG